jgi:phospholipid-translocating ATPase
MPPLERRESEISTPVNRIRWASKRESGKSGVRKRESLIRRFQHMRSGSGEKKHGSRAASAASKRASTATTATNALGGGSPGVPGQVSDVASRKSDDSGSQASSQPEETRKVFFNIPLPDDARDEDGRPKAQYARNKIRTAKYTPISFIPKNLYYQFHNIANMYFLFIIVLGVSLLDLVRAKLTATGV